MLLQYNKKPLNVVIELAGSKSISNRLLILKEVLNLKPELKNLSTAKDTKTLIEAIAQINLNKNHTINIGDAGTDMRFLTALLCLKEGEWTLTGSERMKERPIKHLVDALKKLDAQILYLEKEGFPPLKINGGKLNGGKIEIDGGISSQFISALLLIAPALKNGLEIKIANKTVSWSYIQMTIDVLKELEISITKNDDVLIVPQLSIINCKSSIVIESDWSSASYWFSIAALAPNAKIILKGLQKNSSQGDFVLTEIYKSFGVSTEFNNSELILTKNSNITKFFEYDFSNCPDIAQTVAVTCFGLKINCRLTGLSTLKNKETDRLFALKTELQKLGAKVEITNDSIVIENQPETRNQNLKICTYNDHRMVMSFAPLIFLYDKIEIENPSVVEKSYPEFWEDLKTLIDTN